jgi:hypothetical protein
MGIALPPAVKSALMDPRCVKILSTVNKNGDTHLSFKSSFRIRPDDDLECDEFYEYSLNNQNMFYAIWCDKIVVLNIHTYDRRSYKLIVRPRRALVLGDDFFEQLRLCRELGYLTEFETLWVIEPLSVIELVKETSENEEVEEEPVKKAQVVFQFNPRQSIL